ncbi:MAG: Na+/H+ antiporter subunit E [Lachnospiraceae bacterium]|nr:Na+/H+ antiporter subunit E [Lachnospiraceae bacterium]
MVRIVLGPNARHMKSGIIRIPAAENIKNPYALFMVSSSITLTPGTITLDVAEDRTGRKYYYVHWIDVRETDREKAGDIIKGRMEKWIGRIWG